MRRTNSSDIVVVAGDMDVQVGRLGGAEALLSGCLVLTAGRTDRENGLLQLFADQRLFLCSTNFRNKRHLVPSFNKPTLYSD